MIIRKAKKEDIPQIKRIDRFGEQLNRYTGLDKLDANFKPKRGERGYYEKFISGKKKWCYVAEENGRILGFILFNIEKRQRYFKIKRIGYIDLVYTDKKSRGRGISKLLVDKAREIFKKEGIKHLKLSVHAENPAHTFWKKIGFKDYRVDMFKVIK